MFYADEHTNAPSLSDLLENDEFDSYAIANDFNPKTSGPRTVTIKLIA